MKKIKSPTKKINSGAVALLKIADRIGRQARKADNLVNWREKISIIIQGHADGKDKPDGILKAAQTFRDAGRIDPDQALSMIVGAVGHLSEKTIMTDPKLNDLSDKMGVICKREGLGEDDYFTLNDPKTPKDWLALNEKYDRRVNEIEAAILKRYGEDEIADLTLNDPGTLRRRGYAGLRLWEKDNPKMLSDINKAEKEDIEAKKAGATPS
jgi:hypothetical protein